MRYFEKISYKQFVKDVKDDKELYNWLPLPKRGTAAAAGYDFALLEDVTLNPGEIKKIATGVKANMPQDEALFIFVRSGMGFKHNIRLCNQVGIVDADYYNNESNEGHIFIKVQNEGDKQVTIEKGKAIAQGIFIKYNITDNDIAGTAKRTSDK